MNEEVSKPRVIVALDKGDRAAIDAFVAKVNPSMCRLKIGSHAFTRLGPDYVRVLIQKGFSVFLDLKFHDIPKTVFDACKAAAELGVWMVNVHVAGGKNMLLAAHDAIHAFPKKKRPLLIGVTVLTSLDQADLVWFGFHESIDSIVLRFAMLAKECGLDGVVCSAEEAPLIRKKIGKDFLLVTPGIRFPDEATQDQKRVVTPDVAFQNGADYIVMGRSITAVKDPGTRL